MPKRKHYYDYNWFWYLYAAVLLLGTLFWAYLAFWLLPLAIIEAWR